MWATLRVRYVTTKDHLRSDRNFDADYQRAAGLSAFNKAERVNAAETKAVAKADVPSLLALGRPSTSADLEKSRRGFQMAMPTAIGGGSYDKLNFKPCDGRAWRGPRLPFVVVPKACREWVMMVIMCEDLGKNVLIQN
ncbi:hypothetical protein CYMTET_34843 [Cymbomonas tetramitiformis]|uniref:Uncharacterized protein n=1 Tax=Cymbomonas tetramitiformis TaxID=36881 RepID=A0AAE0FAG3_9CHLO|nr:hypothetical protein CYMTET_34843 [Cymbomonas tetramitiformis]